MIPQLIGLAVARLVCLVKGHKRGKRSDPWTVNCPRCGRPKKREKRAKAP